MPRDYKHRAQAKKNNRKQSPTSVAWWKWLLVVLIIAVFVGFLNFLRTSTPETAARKVTPVKTKPVKRAKKPVTPKTENKVEKPHFEFYTRLPKETVVTDYEIKTRVREERVGKNKPVNYMIQAGSFRDFADADKRRAQLALMGFESHIEKARIGNTVWHRIKLGPFSRPSAVSTIQSRLKQAGIDVIITEK
jgi:cell division protein FtsN